MLLHFYLISLLFILLSLGIALVQKKKETTIRSLTLLLLLHITCFVLWRGVLAFSVFIAVVLSLSLYEVARCYPTNKINYFLLSLVSLFLLLCGLVNNQSLIELSAVWLMIISLFIFIRDAETIHLPSFLFLFSSGFLIPGSIFLIKIMEINSAAIIVILLLLQFNDAFGYLFGKKLGKTYLFPTISPNKTLEGYLCGGAGIILGILILHTYLPILSNQSLIQDLIIFTTILILGNLGDLTISSLKRKLAIKDFSQILPGHGGVLDRFDNTFFTAPIFYILLHHHFIL